MADDPKEPHNRPPLADKGDARPLTQGAPGDGKADNPSSVKHPSGLHTRPDLYGARAVIRRPTEQAPTASGDADRPEGEDADDDAPQRDAAGRVAESEPEQTGSAEAPVPPAANLLDHPPRIPESVAFEDRMAPSPSEPEDGTRVARATATAPSDKDRARQRAPREEPVAGTRYLGEDELVDPGRTPTPPIAEAGPAGRLIAWLREEADIRRLRDDRWPLAVAAVSGAALLLAVVAGGIIGLSGDDEETVQQAQGLDVPAADEALPSGEDPAAPSMSVQQDVPVAPAGSNFGVDRPSRAGPERSSAMIADRTGSSQLATLPESRGMAPPDESREPIVDFMRIDPDGKAVVAGRASPGTELIVLDNGEPLGSITADIYGLWTFVSQDPLASGRHEIGLRVKRQGSEVSDPTLVTDGGPAGSGNTESSAEMPSLAADDAGGQVPAARDQLAAAEPAGPVESDETLPEASAEASAAGTSQVPATPEPAGPAETASAEPAEAAPEAGPPDETASASPSDSASTAASGESAGATKSDSTSAAAPESTSKAAAEPEPAKKVQTAAATPANGDYVVQLASFKNPETAVREQTIVEEKFSDLLAGHDVFVQQVDLAEQGTYYRVRLGPFASLADARSACARFQERDHDCLALAR